MSLTSLIIRLKSTVCEMKNRNTTITKMNIGQGSAHIHIALFAKIALLRAPKDTHILPLFTHLYLDIKRFQIENISFHHFYLSYDIVTIDR